MDLASFIIASVACITVICYLAATAVKQPPLANKWLPSICGALGGLLGVAAMYKSGGLSLIFRDCPPLIFYALFSGIFLYF